MLDKIKNKKIILFGEIHGTKEIPVYIRKLCRIILRDRNNILYLLELPKEIEPKINKFIRKEISKKELIKDRLLEDSICDGRFTPSILRNIKSLSSKGVKFKCIDSVEGKPSERDKDMAGRVVKLIKKYPKPKILLHIGNFHVSSKKIRYKNRTWKPFKLYLPPKIINNSVTIICTAQKGSFYNQGVKKVKNNSLKNKNAISLKVSPSYFR